MTKTDEVDYNAGIMGYSFRYGLEVMEGLKHELPPEPEMPLEKVPEEPSVPSSELVPLEPAPLATVASEPPSQRASRILRSLRASRNGEHED